MTGWQAIAGGLIGVLAVIGGYLSPAISDRIRNGTAKAKAVKAHDGFTPHPHLTPQLALTLRGITDELVICKLNHPEDERLARMEASLRWLLGERR